MKFRSILNNYSSLTSTTTKISPPKHNITHKIVTSGRPVSCKTRPLSPKYYKLVKEKFISLEKQGIVRRAKPTEWSSPLHVVVKKNSKDIRIVGDYRQLNAITEKDTYSVPSINDLSNNIGKSTIFSKIDLKNAYFHVPVDENSIHKTTISTPFASYSYLRAPFGLVNSGKSFQRLIDTAVSDLPFIFPYVDDILIFSSSEDEHCKHLNKLFQRLDEFGLKLNVNKSQFGLKEIDFLGYRISSKGLQPIPEKIKAIKDFPMP